MHLDGTTTTATVNFHNLDFKSLPSLYRSMGTDDPGPRLAVRDVTGIPTHPRRTLRFVLQTFRVRTSGLMAPFVYKSTTEK